VKTRWVPSSFGKPRRRRMDMHFKASSSEEAVRWATAFGDQGCYVNLLPCPEKLSQQQAKGSPVKEQVVTHVPMKRYYQHRMLVVLNPRSGRGRARKVFRIKVQPILEASSVFPCPHFSPPYRWLSFRAYMVSICFLNQPLCSCATRQVEFSVFMMFKVSQFTSCWSTSGFFL
jgi:hypothetical protein